MAGQRRMLVMRSACQGLLPSRAVCCRVRKPEPWIMKAVMRQPMAR